MERPIRYDKTTMMTIAASTHATNRLVDMRLTLENGECHFLLVSHDEEGDALTEDWYNQKECERAMLASQPKRFKPEPHQPRYTSDCIEVKQGHRRIGERMTLRGTPPLAIFRPLRRRESHTVPCEVD
jgi:hypothetical protein